MTFHGIEDTTLHETFILNATKLLELQAQIETFGEPIAEIQRARAQQAKKREEEMPGLQAKSELQSEVLHGLMKRATLAEGALLGVSSAFSPLHSFLTETR